MLKIYIQLLLLGLVIAFFAVLFYLLKRKTKFGNLPRKYEQIIIGIVFGGLAIMGTELGIHVGNATANVRDAAPLCAAMIFGAPAGIIAGVIGGVERYFAAYWGRGFYTQYACSISTIIAGFFGAFLRKFMLDNKRPSAVFGFVAGVIMEVLHLTILFITHLNDPIEAITVVEVVSLPMIFGTAVAVSLASLFVGIISREVIHRGKKSEKKITRQIQKWLLVVITISYLSSNLFVFQIQTNTANLNAKNLLEINLNDAISDLGFAFVDGTYLTKDEAIQGVLQTRKIEENGYFVVYDNNHNLIYNGGDAISLNDLENVEALDFVKATINDTKYFAMYNNFDNYQIIALMTQKEAYFLRSASFYISSFMQILIFAVLFILIYFMIKQMVVANINKVNNNLHEITNGNLDVVVDVNYNREFSSLSNDINKTVDTLKSYIEKEKTRIDSELALAKSIQLSSLPVPILDDRFDLKAMMVTAKEVGGDFYDYYLLNDNELVFMVADVSGKGVPAAMFMMRAKSVIKSLATMGYSVSEVLTLANSKLCEHNDAEMFLTAWMGILNIEKGILSYASAGHNPPLLCKKDGSFTYLKDKPGFILAGLDTVRYKENSIKIGDGDRLFLYTDGATEATNENDKLYGEERLLNFLNQNKELPPEEVLKAVKSDIDKFVGAREQFDDITMMEILYTGKEKMKSKSFITSPNMLNDATSFVMEELELNEASFKSINQITVALEEIFINISHYAYPGGVGEVIIKVVVNDGVCTIIFIDNGVPFNPLEKEEPDISASAENRKVGGLGIFLVKKMMDSVSYEYQNGSNILTISKSIK